MGRPRQFNRDGVLDRAIPVTGNTALRTRPFSIWNGQPASIRRAYGVLSFANIICPKWYEAWFVWLNMFRVEFCSNS
jgi:hypothetical protein